MTSEGMYQLFQVLYDQIDSQLYPELYPEQVFDFLNLEVDRWCQQARRLFETSSELTDYLLPLVVDVYTENVEPVGTEAIFSLRDLRHSETAEIIPYRYMLAAKNATCTLPDGKKGLTYLKEQTHNQRTANQQNPFTKPVPYLCYYTLADNRMIVDVDPSFHLGRGRFTILKQPVTISRSQNSDLPESLHRLLVEMAANSAKTKLQPVQQ